MMMILTETEKLSLWKHLERGYFFFTNFLCFLAAGCYYDGWGKGRKGETTETETPFQGVSGQKLGYKEQFTDVDLKRKGF